MSLHSGIDTIAFVTGGWYSETYGAGDHDNIADLFCSYGLLEDVPAVLAHFLKPVELVAVILNEVSLTEVEMKV